MSLLDKFETVTVLPENRISKGDIAFCEAHQKAYDAARATLKALIPQIEAANQDQKELVGTGSNYFSGEHHYLEDMRNQLLKIHRNFVNILSAHFRETYNVKIDDADIQDTIIPDKPRISHWDSSVAAKEKAYQDKMEALNLHWEDILDRIFAQLGGISFQDKAVMELKERCNQAAWSYSHSPGWMQKKAVLSFARMCGRRWYWEDDIELYDDMKNILLAAAFFETGSHAIPQKMEKYLGWRVKADEMESDLGGVKLSRIKCFKNGRVDLRFTSEAYATQFIREFCGTVPPPED